MSRSDDINSNFNNTRHPAGRIDDSGISHNDFYIESAVWKNEGE